MYRPSVLGQPSDHRLARRAAAGDRGAFDEIVVRHRERVYAIALRVCGDRDDAEDALQETFIAAFRALPGFRGGAQLSTWLYRIALNKSYDIVGRRRPQVTLDEVAEPAAPVDEYAASGARRDIAEALAELPPDFRSAAVLCDVLGLTPSEAAAVLDVPAGTVKSRSFRARALLARALAQDEEPSGADTVKGIDGGDA
jgi:RNA polymerase sigma-70 factor (ECF subfamily)